MAIPIRIGRLIGLGRAGSDLTEFMAEPEPSALLHTICAFANDIRNAGGGYIVLGAEPVPETHDIRISGIAPDSAEALLGMVSGISRLIVPFYDPKAETVMHEGKCLMVLRCRGGRGRPTPPLRMPMPLSQEDDVTSGSREGACLPRLMMRTGSGFSLSALRTMRGHASLLRLPILMKSSSGTVSGKAEALLPAVQERKRSGSFRMILISWKGFQARRGRGTPPYSCSERIRRSISRRQ